MMEHAHGPGNLCRWDGPPAPLPATGGTGRLDIMDDMRSIFDEVDEAAKAKAIAEAEADVAAGRVVPHEKVAEWLRALATAYEQGLPRPKPPIPDDW